ncbi:MAG TPA: bifunctional shikimate kinase/3-dehydroquinate synthase [Solirubrobacteraceae bacterium]|nr:bifunctional shikimate kinase/3-dehydroquinate synthase [Solirubrobacteraceae bacterium]
MIVLVGFMGAGKTTVGHIVAERLGMPFVDSDLVIEQRLQRTIRDIFAIEGEVWFRDLERQVIDELIRGPEAVVALGGGALGDARTRAVLRNSHVVYLDVELAEAMERVRHDEYRPLLHRAGLDELYSARDPVYRDIAGLRVDTNGRRPEAVAREVLSFLTALPSLPAGVRSVFISPVGGTYHAYIGSSLLGHVPSLVPGLEDAEAVALVHGPADRAEAQRVADNLEATGLRVYDFLGPDSESAKTFAAAAELAEAMAEVALHRSDVMVVVGGEPLCELAGFVAATFNRGMSLVLVPTTLVGQADSAVGGKNGLNLSQGRNLVGTIHQPRAVICDVDVALDHRDRGFKAGLAEIAKHGFISATGLLDVVQASAGRAVAGDPEVIQDLVVRSLEVKADVVSRDEREQGDRTYLNYGHTFAHAIDQIAGSEMDGGDSLGLGLCCAAELARAQNRLEDSVVDLHREVLRALGLQTRGRLDLEAMQAAWLRDKKYWRGVRFVVLNDLGSPESGVTADQAVLREVVARVGGERDVTGPRSA